MTKTIKILIIVLLTLLFVPLTASADSITFDGMGSLVVTGYNETVGCTFQNLYDADQVNGWGFITLLAPDSYSISCMIQLGNTTHDGYFSDVNTVIVSTVGGYYLFTQYGNGHLRLGEIADINSKLGKNGCIIYASTPGSIFYITTGQKTLELYDTTFKGIGGTIRVGLSTDTVGNVWDCKFSRVYFYGAAGNLSLHSVSVTMPNDMTDYGSYNFMAGVNGSIDNMEFYGAYYPFYFRVNYNGVFYINNVVAREYYRLIRFHRSSGAVIVNAVDWDVEEWNFYFYRSPGCKVNRMYTLNLHTSPTAKITIMNHTDIVYQDYANVTGVINEQTFLHTMYRQGSTITQNPYSIKIEKPGYHTFTQTFNITKPIDWVIMLEPVKETHQHKKSPGLIMVIGMLVGGMVLIVSKRKG